MQISNTIPHYLPAAASYNRRPNPIEEEGRQAGRNEETPVRSQTPRLSDDRDRDQAPHRQAAEDTYRALLAANAAARGSSEKITYARNPSAIRQGFVDGVSPQVQRAIAAYEGTAVLNQRHEISVVLGVDVYA